MLGIAIGHMLEAKDGDNWITRFGDKIIVDTLVFPL